MPQGDTRRRPLPDRLGSVIRHYVTLGFTSFGGPGVHVVILRKRFVDTLKWVDERTFLDLFALGNALPGPGSTQLAFSIAVVKHGVLPGLVAFLCWSLPGATGMAGLAAGISNIPEQLPPIVLALLSGLNAAAVGLIALAAYQLGTAASTDKITLSLVWLSASFGVCYHAPWMYPVLIVAGGSSTLLWDFRRQWFLVPAKRLMGRTSGTEESGMELSDITPRSTSTATPANTHTPPPSHPHTSVFPSPPQSPVTGPAQIHPDPSKLDLSIPAACPTVQRRPNSTHHTDPESSPPTITQQDNPLQVVSSRSAFALIGGFVLLLVIPLATRGGLSHAGKEVPRALDVSPC